MREIRFKIWNKKMTPISKIIPYRIHLIKDCDENLNTLISFFLEINGKIYRETVFSSTNRESGSIEYDVGILLKTISEFLLRKVKKEQLEQEKK
jgi:hypothetical protein